MKKLQLSLTILFFLSICQSALANFTFVINQATNKDARITIKRQDGQSFRLQVNGHNVDGGSVKKPSI